MAAAADGCHGFWRWVQMAKTITAAVTVEGETTQEVEC